MDSFHVCRMTLAMNHGVLSFNIFSYRICKGFIYVPDMQISLKFSCIWKHQFNNKNLRITELDWSAGKKKLESYFWHGGFRDVPQTEE